MRWRSTDRRFVRFLFNNTRAGLFWLPIRLFVGFRLARGRVAQARPRWVDAGRHRPARGTGSRRSRSLSTGSAADHVRVVPRLHPPAAQRQGRELVRLAGHVRRDRDRDRPDLRGFTGVAAFFGALMNMSFLLAGSASTNPVLFTMAVGLMLAWRVAGYYGVDRYLLPALGAPWRPGTAFRREAPVEQSSS